MSYAVHFTRQAERDFEALSASLQKRVSQKIDLLAIDPRPPDVKKLSDKDDIYRVRVGDYRILYNIEDKKLIVLVLRIVHRSKAYKK